MSKRSHLLQVDQLDRKLRFFQDLPADQKTPPRSGWIGTIRKALGMSGEVLAARMGVSQPAEAQFEKGERDKSISLQTLEKVADALDAELVYAIVPRRPIKRILQEKAMEKARQRILPLAHSMNLESQGISDLRLEEEVKELAQQLVSRPKELWR